MNQCSKLTKSEERVERTPDLQLVTGLVIGSWHGGGVALNGTLILWDQRLSSGSIRIELTDWWYWKKKKNHT